MSKHSFISYLLVLCLLAPSFAVAEGDAQSTATTTAAKHESDLIDKANDFTDGKSGVSRTVARPISKYVLQKMGTPGFLVSKFMAYRKVMNQPLCTTSEKLNFAATLLTLAGDVTNHVLAWKHKEKLKKEFSGKSDGVKEYLKSTDDILAAPQETGELRDVQLMALDYSIRSEELELERLKVLKMFKYPALALYLTANILNAQEALAEGSSFGTYLAEVNACHEAHKPKTVANEAKTEAEAAKGIEAAKSASPEEPAWYIKPFLWIGGKAKEAGSYLKEKGNDIKNTETFQTVSSGTKKMDVQDESLQSDYGGVSPLSSANYAEEMIVGVVSGLRNEKKKSSIGDKVKSEVIDIGIRLAVRKVVKLNIEAVDKFMRSSIGRNVVYAYNLWVIYSEFDQMQKQIKNTRTKIAALKEIRGRYTSSSESQTVTQTVREEFNEIYQVVLNNLIMDAYAANPDPEFINSIKMCLGVENCSQKQTFLDANVKASLIKLPTSVRDHHINFLKGSYSFKAVQQFNNGKISIQSINQTQVQKEITQYESEVERLADLMDKKNIFKKSKYKVYEEKLLNDDYKWYSELMRPDFNQVGLMASVGPQFSLPKVENKSHDFTIENSEVESQTKETKVTDHKALEAVRLENKYNEVMKAEFDWDDIHKQSERNIWDIISNRYQSTGERLKTIP